MCFGLPASLQSLAHPTAVSPHCPVTAVSDADCCLIAIQWRASFTFIRYNGFEINFSPLFFARFHQRRLHSAASRGPRENAAWSAVCRADWRTRRFVLSKLGLRHQVGTGLSVLEFLLLYARSNGATKMQYSYFFSSYFGFDLDYFSHAVSTNISRV